MISSDSGSRAGSLERERLIKLTTVVSPDVAEAFLHELTDSLLPAYGVKAVKAVQHMSSANPRARPATSTGQFGRAFVCIAMETSLSISVCS